MNVLQRFRAAASRGFTLVEVTLALGIAVFCLVVVFGLLNVGINTSSSSIEQTNATSILSAVAADLHAAPTPSTDSSGNPVAGAASAVYGLMLPTNATTGNGTPAFSTSPTNTLTLDANGQPATVTTPARYKLEVWMKPGAGRDATQVRLMISWPPTTALLKSGSVETFVALDRN